MQLSTFLITVFSLHVVIFTRLWVKKRDSYYGLIVITFALLVLTQVLILTASELSLGNVPVYWTEPENVASQGLCRGLGYWQYAQQSRFKWVRT